MGRETYLLPVTWELEPMEWHSLGPEGKRLWPVCAPDTGRVDRRQALPMGATQSLACNVFSDNFEKDHFGISFGACLCW